jgi:hypothetical protein
MSSTFLETVYRMNGAIGESRRHQTTRQRKGGHPSVHVPEMNPSETFRVGANAGRRTVVLQRRPPSPSIQTSIKGYQNVNSDSGQ